MIREFKIISVAEDNVRIEITVGEKIRGVDYSVSLSEAELVAAISNEMNKLEATTVPSLLTSEIGKTFIIEEVEVAQPAPAPITRKAMKEKV